jgi:hypothetical protein
VRPRVKRAEREGYRTLLPSVQLLHFEVARRHLRPKPEAHTTKQEGGSERSYFLIADPAWVGRALESQHAPRSRGPPATPPRLSVALARLVDLKAALLAERRARRTIYFFQAAQTQL